MTAGIGITFIDTASLTTASPLLEGEWGSPVDYRERYYDFPGGGEYATYPGPTIASFQDRQNGDYFPIYENEVDLAANLGISQGLVALEPRAKGVQSLLTNYVIGTGYKFTAQQRKNGPIAPEGLVRAIQEIVDLTLEVNNFLCGMDREIHDRSREDGEVLIAVEPGPGGISRFREFEPMQLAEPDNTREIEEYLEQTGRLDCSGPVDWKYGVCTPGGRPDIPLGYYLTLDAKNGDWEFYPESRMEHIKRNVPRRAKRGIPDYWWVFRDMQIEGKIRRNTGTGTAINAAIAYIRQHPAGTSADKAKGMATDYRRGLTSVPTQWGSKNVSNAINSPGTVLDTAGFEYKEGPLGANRNEYFLLPGNYILRCCGTFWQVPEYMFTGDASNGNYSSTLVAESPFVKSRKADQMLYGNHSVSLLWKAARLTCDGIRVLQKFGISWQEMRRMIEISFEPPAVETHDPGAISERQQRDIQMGTLSRRTAIAESGRDPDQELRYIAEERQEAASAATSVAGAPGQHCQCDGGSGNGGIHESQQQENCGTGYGGFKDGNNCAAGDGSKMQNNGLIRSENGYEIFPAVVFTDNNADALSVKIGRNGEVKVIVPSGFSVRSNRDYIKRRVQRAIDEYLSPLEKDVFVRMSNNPDDYKHLESGSHRGSINHATGESEYGLSVAKRREIPAKYAYLVKGEVVADGSDGEPVLDIKTARPVSELMSQKKFDTYYKREQLKHLKKIGWTEDQARNAFVYLSVITDAEHKSLLSPSGGSIQGAIQGAMESSETAQEVKDLLRHLDETYP